MRGRREEFMRVNPWAGIIGCSAQSSWLRLGVTRVVFLVQGYREQFR